jgi:hypothetical protein
MAWAEAEAEERGGTLSRRGSRWRRNKASEKQINYARGLGIQVPDDARSGDVANMISTRLSSHRLDHYLAPALAQHSA